jgi:hypothetical protein
MMKIVKEPHLENNEIVELFKVVDEAGNPLIVFVTLEEAETYISKNQ